MIVIWLFIKPSFSWISLVCLMIYPASISRVYQLNNKQASNKDALKIMSYNIRGNQLFEGKNKETREKKKRDFKSFLDQHSDVDIFCFQEQGASTSKVLDILFDQHESPSEKYRGTDIYTKLPVRAKGNIKLERNSHNAFWVDLETSNGIVRVYNIHLSSNRISMKTDQLIEEHDLSDQELWSDIKYIFKKYAIHSKKRLSQIELVLEHVDKSPYPVILCGDFNDVPQSYIYTRVSKKRRDSFVYAGNGIGKTYQIFSPSLRIDYFFADPEFDVLEHLVLDEPFSDHYPIRTSVQLMNK